MTNLELKSKLAEMLPNYEFNLSGKTGELLLEEIKNQFT